MTELQREHDVVHAFVSLVDALLGDFDIVELLTTLAEQCGQLVDVAAAGLLLADARGELNLLAATSRRAHDLEVWQLQAQQGPCLDCYRTGAPVSVADLAETERWPAFSAAARAYGFVSVHAVPLRAATKVVGALGLFGTASGTLSSHDTDVAQALAHVATVAILQSGQTIDEGVVAPSLHNALLSRVTVDQATGYLFERTGLSLQESFNRLRDLARRSDRHLTDVSRSLLDPTTSDGVMTQLLRNPAEAEEPAG